MKAWIHGYRESTWLKKRKLSYTQKYKNLNTFDYQTMDGKFTEQCE